MIFAVTLLAVTNYMSGYYVVKHPYTVNANTLEMHISRIRSELKLKQYSEKEMNALMIIVKKESNFQPWLYNGGKPYKQRNRSSAFGLFQGLKGTYSNYGHSTYGSLIVRDQIIFGMDYIDQRYGSPLKALAFHRQRGWY